jgi:hypothetical protein
VGKDVKAAVPLTTSGQRGLGFLSCSAPGFALRFLPSSSSVVDVPANDWADIMNAGV